MSILDGKVAIITGGSSGIGLATAKRFVAEGVSVFIMGRRRAELDKAVAEIGGNVTAISGHIANLGICTISTRSLQARRGSSISSWRAQVLQR